MMCEGVGETGARTGSVSATFTLFGQRNATLRASSHFFLLHWGSWAPLGQGVGEKGGKGMKGGVKRDRLWFKPNRSARNCFHI